MSFSIDDQISNWLKTREPHWPQFVENVWQLDQNENAIQRLAQLCWAERNFQNFAALVRHCILNERNLPWAYFCEFLFNFTKDFAKGPKDNAGQSIKCPPFFLKAIEETNSIAEVCEAPSAILLGQEFKEYLVFKEAKKRQKLHIHKQHLLSEYEVAHFQRLTSEQDRILTELSSLYPRDPQIGAFKLQRDEERASDSLGRHSHFEELSDSIVQPMASEHREFFDYLLQQMVQKVESASIETIYEFAIMFEFLEAHEFALEMMDLYGKKHRELRQEASETVSASEIHDLRLWRVLDLLVSNRQWVAALNLADQLETRFSDVPDASFSASFIRAQCLWALGQKSSGIELLKSLLIIRPRFKNGEALLRSWLGSSHDS